MCAARSCLGTEVTGGSCIARVGFVCRKEEKVRGIRTALVHRARRAPVQPSPVITPVPAQAIRAVIVSEW